MMDETKMYFEGYGQPTDTKLQKRYKVKQCMGQSWILDIFSSVGPPIAMTPNKENARRIVEALNESYNNLELKRTLTIAKAALERLSVLGNGTQLGNSIGNIEARNALIEMSN